MPRYKVELTQSTWDGANIYVEADSREEAEQKALATHPAQIPWKFISAGDIEVVNVEELKGEG